MFFISKINALIAYSQQMSLFLVKTDKPYKFFEQKGNIIHMKLSEVINIKETRICWIIFIA